MLAQQISIDDYIKDVVRNLTTIESKITASGESISQAAAQIDVLHRKDDGFITIAVKRDKQWVQYHYKSEQLQAHIGKALSIEGVNIYLTPNSFYKPFRRLENVRKLNSLYIDLDYYNLEGFKGLTADQIIWQLEKDYFRSKVPEASFIVITGRGIAIYWLIEPVPIMALPLWNAVQKHFLKELKEIGADDKSIDAARVMRLAGSTNQKSGKRAELLIYNQDRYVLRALQQEYLPKLTPYVKNPCHRQRGRKANVVKLYTVYTLHLARLLDITKLVELREGYCRAEDGSLTATGQREFMCFLYRYWSCCYSSDTKKALEDTIEFNKGFKFPLPEKEVERQTKSAEKAYREWLDNEFNKKKDDKKEAKETKEKNKKISGKKGYKFKGYNYKNETLIEILNITEDEIKQLKTIIDKGEVKKRNNERTKVSQKAKRRDEKGLTKRQQDKMEKIQRIQQLIEEGLKQNEISKEMNLSIRMTKYYIKQIKEKLLNI